MSGGNVIMASSDEDRGLVQDSEGNKCISTDAAQTSLEMLLSNGANEISSLKLSRSSLIAAIKKKGKDMWNSQPDNLFLMGIDSENSSDGFDISENKIFIHESEAFKKFISVVLPAEPDENDRAKIVKKIDKYLRVADPSYLRSPEFSEIMEKGVRRILSNSLYLYFVLKDVKDALLSHQVEYTIVTNFQERISSLGENALEKPPEDSSSESEDLQDEDKEERKRTIVNKLTLLLQKVDEKIKELEELEVDFSDEEDSNYIKMQRYRQRFCEVYEKLCNYTNKPLNGNRVGGVKKINFSDTDNLEFNRAVEKWLNKNRQFPDYSDVNNLMSELNQSLNLNLTKEQLKIKAQQIFENIGNKLQRRRHFDLWDSLSSFLSTDVDPAVQNPELESLLQKNYELGLKKEIELLRHFVEMQEREQLQPREVPDEEANCSPTESGDEDEEEMETTENILDSKISTDDDEYDGGSEKTCNNESDDDSFCFSDSEKRNKDPNEMNIQPETRVENNSHQRISVSNDNCEHINEVGSKGVDPHVCVNSEITETDGTNIGTIPVTGENTVDIPNKQDTEANLVSKSENLMKRKNENLNEDDNDNVNIHPCKKFLEEKEMTETRNFEETEIINKSGSDSDCQIIEIVSNKEGEISKALSLKPEVHQVNYAFTNNNFSYNTVLSNNISKKNHCFPSNYKNVKNQKPLDDVPPNESTNIKSTTNKSAVQRENKVKRKVKKISNKPKSINSTTCQASNDSDLKNNDFAISTDSNSINCSLNQEKSGENMKSQKDVNKTNQNNDSQQGSSNETAAPPNGGSSSGGNGQDNSENNGNKKPFDRETQTEDNPENEDEEEDEEEDADTAGQKPSKTPKVIEAAPKPTCSRTNRKGQKVSGGAVSKLPPTEKVVPVRRNSLGKKSEKPPASETPQRKEPANSTPTARSPRAKPAPVRKRKVNQNSGGQGTPQPGKPNTFIFQFKKGSADLSKLRINKPKPAASTSKNNNVEVIQAAKKKRSAPVKSVQSDEEIVKNFLERSNPSISITTPKKKAVQKEPSPSVRQALETLSRLKGISATIVKGSSKHNTDEEVTIIAESLNTRVNKISKQQKTPAASATTTVSPQPLLPKIVTVQGNVPGFEDIVDESTVIPDNSHQNYVQNPQAASTSASGINSNYSEHLYNTQGLLVNVSGNGSNYNEHFYSLQAPVATVPGSASSYQENVHAPQAPVASTSGSTSNYQENFYVLQAPIASTSGSTSNYQENFYVLQAPIASTSGSTSNYQENFYALQTPVASTSGSTSNYQENFYALQTPVASTSGSTSNYQENFHALQTPVASTSGSTSTYEENFTGKVECIPIPRFRNVRSRSRRTPKKTKNIEYIILD